MIRFPTGDCQAPRLPTFCPPSGWVDMGTRVSSQAIFVWDLICLPRPVSLFYPLRNPPSLAAWTAPYASCRLVAFCQKSSMHFPNKPGPCLGYLLFEPVFAVSNSFVVSPATDSGCVMQSPVIAPFGPAPRLVKANETCLTSMMSWSPRIDLIHLESLESISSVMRTESTVSFGSPGVLTPESCSCQEVTGPIPVCEAPFLSTGRRSRLRRPRLG
ncbi:hypothetical protein F4778DRAFT_214678 [Xylariomycetidae sp. FL2044]|nr:hypothetical protein F4778DRAFT_214678 [Xylariomycetidae sp. FL2044]